MQEKSDDGLRVWITEIVLEEVDSLTAMHTHEDANKFNNDKRYKTLTTEAIDAKTMALRKIDFFLEKGTCRTLSTDRELLKRITDMPFMEFAHPSTKLELETGDGGFPWKQVTRGAANVDFLKWRPLTKDAQGRLDWEIPLNHFNIMVDSIAGNQHVRVISVEVARESKQLHVPNGWAGTVSLNWSKSVAVQDAPGIVNMLLRCCTNLVDLNIRQVQAVGLEILSLSMFLLNGTCFASSNELGDNKARLILPALGVLKNLQDLNLRFVLTRGNSCLSLSACSDSQLTRTPHSFLQYLDFATDAFAVDRRVSTAALQKELKCSNLFDACCFLFSYNKLTTESARTISSILVNLSQIRKLCLRY